MDNEEAQQQQEQTPGEQELLEQPEAEQM